jgi:hypothetical protein
MPKNIEFIILNLDIPLNIFFKAGEELGTLKSFLKNPALYKAILIINDVPDDIGETRLRSVLKATGYRFKRNYSIDDFPTCKNLNESDIRSLYTRHEMEEFEFIEVMKYQDVARSVNWNSQMA